MIKDALLNAERRWKCASDSTIAAAIGASCPDHSLQHSLGSPFALTTAHPVTVVLQNPNAMQLDFSRSRPPAGQPLLGATVDEKIWTSHARDIVRSASARLHVLQNIYRLFILPKSTYWLPRLVPFPRRHQLLRLGRVQESCAATHASATRSPRRRRLAGLWSPSPEWRPPEPARTATAAAQSPLQDRILTEHQAPGRAKPERNAQRTNN